MTNDNELVRKFLTEHVYPFIVDRVRMANLKRKIIELVIRYKGREDVECIYLNLPTDPSDFNVTLTIVLNSLLIDLDELRYIREINALADSKTQQEVYGYNFRVALSYRYEYGAESMLVCGNNKFVELFNSKILYDKEGYYTEGVARKGNLWNLKKKPSTIDIDFGPDDFGSNQFDKK